MTYGGVPRYDWPSIDRLRMDASAGDVARDGNGDLVGESAGRDGTYARPPSSPDYGITTYELSQYVRDFARWCAQRVEGVGELGPLVACMAFLFQKLPCDGEDARE